MRAPLVLIAGALAFTSSAIAAPCTEVVRAQKALSSAFASEATRKDGAREKLAVPLFGEPDCAIHRPIGILTQRWIICSITQVSDDDVEDRAFAKSKFDELAATLKMCLPSHIAVDNRANESPSDEIFDRRHYRSADGRETWALTFENENVPSAVLIAELETDAVAVTTPSPSAPRPE